MLVFQPNFDVDIDALAEDPIEDTIDTAVSLEPSFEEQESDEELVIYFNPKYIIDDSYDASLAPKDGIAFMNELLVR